MKAITRGKPIFFLMIAGLLSVVTFGACSSFERKMIFPGAATQGVAAAVVAPTPAFEVLSLEAQDGTAIAALYATALDADGQRASQPERRPTILYFYGNGSCLASSIDQLEGFRRLGANVLIPEYPGYGMSAGRASEAACYAAADAAYEYLLNVRRVTPAGLVIAGWSMGGGVAIDLASRREAAGVATISTFTSMPKVAKALLPWLPTYGLLRTRFDNEAKIPSLRCPVLILHGANDTLIPPKMADQLAAAVKSTKTAAIHFPGVAHNDIFQRGGPALWTALGNFVATATRRTEEPR